MIKMIYIYIYIYIYIIVIIIIIIFKKKFFLKNVNLELKSINQ